jgi:hypothetical protein
VAAGNGTLYAQATRPIRGTGPSMTLEAARRLRDRHVVGHSLGCDAGGEHLLPGPLRDPQGPLVAGGEGLRLLAGTDAARERDSRRLVADPVHVPPLRAAVTVTGVKRPDGA